MMRYATAYLEYYSLFLRFWDDESFIDITTLTENQSGALVTFHLKTALTFKRNLVNA